MHEIRNFIAGLGSDLLQGKDLPTALQHMLDSLTQNHATHVRLTIEDRAAQAVSVEQSLHLLLVIQEAVSNCIRHGHAQEATVSLKMLKQGIRLNFVTTGVDSIRRRQGDRAWIEPIWPPVRRRSEDDSPSCRR